MFMYLFAEGWSFAMSSIDVEQIAAWPDPIKDEVYTLVRRLLTVALRA
jgi:hypothetical protein